MCQRLCLPLFIYSADATRPYRWRLRESVLYNLNRLLQDFIDVSQPISPELAGNFNRYVGYAIQQEEQFLRARGFVVAGVLAGMAGESFRQTAASYLEVALRTIADDPSDVVKVSCVRALQDLVPALPREFMLPLQVPAISAISDFVSTCDLQDPSENDDLKVTLAETLRDVIMVDPKVVLSSIAIDVLFNVASSGANNFQLTMVVTEAFEDIVEVIAREGADSYVRLCEKVLPSLIAAINVGNLTEENQLAILAADLIRALAEQGCEPLPNGFVATIMPKINRLLLESTEPELIRPATAIVRHLLSHDFAQFVAWTDPETGRSAIEVVLVIIARLLDPSVEDNAATEVGELAAELVERAGSERLGPYLPQLLQAVAQRLASAERAPFIQSLCLVFARLTLLSAQEVVDFLAQVDLNGQSGLAVVLHKWLENSVNFAGYDEIKQNAIALTKLYSLEDPRLAQIQVKGDLIVQDTGRIKTRSQARNNPDQYTSVSASVKILKLLVGEFAAASGDKEIDAAAAAGAAGASVTSGGENGEGDNEDEDDDEWEDMPGGGTLDLNLGVTKQELMAFGEGGDEGVFGVRRRDNELQAFLSDFFRHASTKPGFQQMYAALSPSEQEKLQSIA